jgi:hypothetical protein
MEVQEPSNQEKETLAGDVMESMGEPQESGENVDQSHDGTGGTNNDPLYIQKRMKQQKRAHEREIRELHGKIAAMSSQNNPNQNSYTGQPTVESYVPPEGDNIAEHVHKAVSYALRHKEMEESKAKNAERMAHVQKSYQDLNKHLDNVSDKYDDFDDVVRGNDVPFTEHMRDAALFLPQKGAGSAGEVLYKLGKNSDELKRISKLHPLEQARELTALSHALANGAESKGSSSNARPLGNVKSNPVVNSNAITDKTPPSEIRARMKAGKFK